MAPDQSRCGSRPTQRFIIRGIGIDTSDVGRFHRLCEAYGQRFIRRWFTPEEIVQCGAVAPTASAYSARFAAKEAIWKALRLPAWTGPVPWLNMSVLEAVEPPEPVRVELFGELKRAAECVGVSRIHVQFGTIGSLSVATAIAECSEPPR